MFFGVFLSSASSITRRHFCGIAPSAAHKFTHLLKLQVATLSLGPSSRNSCSHRTDSCRDLLLLKDASIDGRSANLTSGWTYRQRVGPLTGHLRHHCLRDPPVPQERFDLLLHHAAVPPASTHKHTHTLSSGESEDALVHRESRVGILRQRHFQRSLYFGWIKRAAAKSQVADETKEGVVCEMKNPDVPVLWILNNSGTFQI